MSKCILFLDDNPYEMQGYADRLRAANFEVIFVNDTDQAMEVLKSKKNIDLLIVDLILPFGPEESVEENHRAGLRFCRAVRMDLHITCPIIILSVLTEEDVLRRAKEFTNHVLPKSILPTDLVARAREIMS